MDMLQVKNGKIVDSQGSPVRLRGVCVGGWMNMEHFIDGYPGDEHGQRAAMAAALGPEKGAFFFDRLLDYFWASEDVAFLKQYGTTVARLPLNYRHFERDDRPFEYLEAGFARLDRAVAWCAQHGIYVILDLHAAQGWQSGDWHCDNSSRHSFFWDHLQFQDRFVGLWQEFARRYRGNPAVAGYNVLNEPVTNAPAGRFSDRYTPNWEVINRIYRRVVAAIREIDPDHLIFLEGDYFSTLFEGLDAPFDPNLVYSSHNYSMAAFGPVLYPNDQWNQERQRQEFMNHQGTQFARRHNVPLWVGEFGAALMGSPEQRMSGLRALDDQIGAFEEFGAHWTIWTYKGLGAMGTVMVPLEAPYMQRIAPISKAKQALSLDMFWMDPANPSRTQELIVDLAQQMVDELGDPEMVPQTTARYLAQAALACYASSLAQPSYARCFAGLSEAELDRVLQSFALRNCVPDQPLLDTLAKYMALPA